MAIPTKHRKYSFCCTSVQSERSVGSVTNLCSPGLLQESRALQARSVPKVFLGVSLGPFWTRTPERPKSVPRVFPEVSWTHRGHSRNTFCTLSLRGLAKPPKLSKPQRLPHCAVFCRTSKRRARCSPDLPKPSNYAKTVMKATPLKLNPPFRTVGKPNQRKVSS